MYCYILKYINNKTIKYKITKLQMNNHFSKLNTILNHIMIVISKKIL